MVAKGKTFDCVEMKHAIQARIARETEGLSTIELMEYYQRTAEESRREHATSAGGKPARTLQELFEAFDREHPAPNDRGSR